MTQQNLKTAIRERMAVTGENHTAARRAVRAARRAQPRSGLNTSAIRDLVASTWSRYCDGTGRPALITDTIPGLCDEVDTLRALKSAVADLADDETVPADVRARLNAALCAAPVRADFTLPPFRRDLNAPLRVPVREIPFPGASTQADLYRSAADRIEGGYTMGSNLTAAVVDVLDYYAGALEDGAGGSSRPRRARRPFLPARSPYQQPSSHVTGNGTWTQHDVTDEASAEAVVDRLSQGCTTVSYDGHLWLVLFADAGDEWWQRLPHEDDEDAGQVWLAADAAAYPRTYWVLDVATTSTATSTAR